MQTTSGHPANDAERRLAETLFFLSLNIIMAVTLGTMLWGVAVLLYAALAAVPVAFVAILAMSWQRSPAAVVPLPRHRRHPRP